MSNNNQAPSTKNQEQQNSAQPSSFEEKVEQYFVSLAEELHVPKSIAVIYSAIFCSSDPVCAEEIQNKTGISKGRTSEGLRFLSNYGMIKQVERHMNRRTFYQPELAMRSWLGGVLGEKLKPMLEQSTETIGELKKAKKSELGGFPKERLDTLAGWTKKLKFILPTLLKIAK